MRSSDLGCIDKKSSAELSEAINSMYRWYKNASECYAYLNDVTWKKSLYYVPVEPCWTEFRQSKWLTRGWYASALFPVLAILQKQQTR